MYFSLEEPNGEQRLKQLGLRNAPNAMMKGRFSSNKFVQNSPTWRSYRLGLFDIVYKTGFNNGVRTL